MEGVGICSAVIRDLEEGEHFTVPFSCQCHRTAPFEPFSFLMSVLKDSYPDDLLAVTVLSTGSMIYCPSCLDADRDHLGPLALQLNLHFCRERNNTVLS